MNIAAMYQFHLHSSFFILFNRISQNLSSGKARKTWNKSSIWYKYRGHFYQNIFLYKKSLFNPDFIIYNDYTKST